MNSILMYLLLLFFMPKDDTPAAYFEKVRPYLKANYNTDIVFYVDLSRPSRDYRFFVLSMKQKKVLSSGLCCNGTTDARGRVVYSNKPNSGCSSKGAYRVGSSYQGSFGTAFKLYGLEATNSNAFKRFIVLHSWRGIPSAPVDYPLVQSAGCPTVNPMFLKELATYIGKSERSILLYIQ